MGGLARLAKALGHDVAGADAGAYAPMSTQLAEAGIRVDEGYDPKYLPSGVDRVVIGNALSRGNPMVEAVLDRGLNYVSGPALLAETVLADRFVIAVAGTHGKTTTASMIAWILEAAGVQPGYLIGGVPANFGASARLTDSGVFVIEADEYDAAFFDKRAKFVHYRPRTVVLNNLEYDHADIYPDLASIQRQFHHLVRTVPASGRLIVNQEEPALDEVLEQGCWTPRETFGGGGDWQIAEVEPDGAVTVAYQGETVASARWPFVGAHNRANALAAVAACRHAGITPDVAVHALSDFAGVQRRQETLYEGGGIRVLDDFAHHPTAIAATLDGVRQAGDGRRIVAVLEPASNSMRQGIHQGRLGPAMQAADLRLALHPPDLSWDLQTELGPGAEVLDDAEMLAARLAAICQSGDIIVLMSNGSFRGLRERLPEVLAGQGAA